MKVREIALSGATAAAIVALVVACGSDDGDQTTEISSGVALQNVTVVNTRDGSLSAPSTVVIANGQIQRVIATSVRINGTAQAIDATGKFLVPGFLDMHTHASNTLGVPPSDFPVLLANGVTGVREAGGSPAVIQTIRQQNADVLAGKADAPEVLMMPSAIFAGQAATDPAARQFVVDRLAEGATFVKAVAGGNVPFLALIDEAKKRRTHAAGHLPLNVPTLDASNAGYHSFEHLGSGMGILLDCSTDAANIRAQALATPTLPAANVVNPRVYDGNAYAPFIQRIMTTYSDATCKAMAQAFVRNDSWQTVTLIRLRTQDFGDSVAYRTDPNLRYVDKTRRALWESIAQQYETTVTPAARATLQQYYGFQLKAVGLLKQNGVRILAGSDLGGGWVIPGFGLHQEFRELYAAGLSPLEVLQATTLSGAQFAGREATMGTVEPGKTADLVVLDANPIADVANLDKVSAVFLKGRYYSRSALDMLLANAAATYSALAVKDLSTAIDPNHSD